MSLEIDKQKKSNTGKQKTAAHDTGGCGSFILVAKLDSNSVSRRYPMPKYLWQASYTAEGAKGLLKEGGSKRREAAEAALKSVGGKLEAFYYAFGDADVFLIAELPDNVSVAAGSMAVNASGAVVVKTTVLLSPEEIDAACKKAWRYRPPGQ